MKTILAHHTGHSFYRSIIRNLIQNHASLYNVNVQVLHRELFNIVHHTKPNIVLLPVAEYTQEFHDFISEYHHTLDIVLIVDKEVTNTQLIGFWRDCNIKIVVDERLSAPYNTHKSIVYSRLYDGDIFSHLNKVRNNKIAVVLSQNNHLNNKVLKQDWLYPNNPDSKLVLFNNPAFQHPQNVGIFNNPDLNIILNTFTYLIDIDDQFPIEAKVCQIHNLDIEQIKDINDYQSYVFKDMDGLTSDLTQRSHKFFTEHTLVPFLN